MARAPYWVLNGEPEPPVLWAVVHLDEVDLEIAQLWHDAAEAALGPLLRPAGAPRFRRHHGGRHGVRVRRRSWADMMHPSLESAYVTWGHGDERPPGPADDVRLHVSRDYDSYLQLDLGVRLLEPSVMPALADAVIGVVRQIGDRIDPGYGEIADRVRLGPSTDLDYALLRDDEDSLRDSHRHLRGYGWVTVCPAAIAAALGGAAAMRAGGAFTEVVELATGGLLLRATRTTVDYDDDAVRRVFEALRPVLPPGLPRQPRYETLPHLVLEDAVTADPAPPAG
ncbi:hypothetical protein Aph02nite_27430 [Actinoplanes philippinensis]|uniref:DUF3396 domain-containing protein n=1 Tax=Actinoplanes philippinensis TaxID=35752 RepID=A0A1I2GAY8_9ACTN|nr:hypothetical protein [Actinoplanes philippinensis]GIE76793.1 hypothetical protein Aph02nite_27430 [Actinoplanes philippinensis]SFF14745.1 hypothetical protein SAMN05421541_106398 [Actinoplanes philippinensis]